MIVKYLCSASKEKKLKSGIWGLDCGFFIIFKLIKKKKKKKQHVKVKEEALTAL